MKEIRNEDNFQDWVIARLGVCGGVHDFSPVGGNVPDLYATAWASSYWLELKYDRFELGHDRYDNFEWSTLKRAQLEWLMTHNNPAVTGVLGYLRTGDHTAYITFHTASYYLKKYWRKGVNVGGVILGPTAVAAHLIKTGPDLLTFIDGARDACLDNEH